MSLELVLILIVCVLAALVAYLLLQRRKSTAVDDEAAKRLRGEIDTVAAWPPEVTRLLNAGERAAHEILVKALPECPIFGQVPLARFIKVPRRNSYTDWLTRVGHLCADLVICDRSTLVLGVVLLQSARESERSERRRARMTRVLKAAGVRVFTWREESLPSREAARDQLIQRLGDLSGRQQGAEDTSPRGGRGTAGGKLPVPEVVAEIGDEGVRREPPPSTWFSDLDSGRVPLDAPRDQPKP